MPHYKCIWLIKTNTVLWHVSTNVLSKPTLLITCPPNLSTKHPQTTTPLSIIHILSYVHTIFSSCVLSSWGHFEFIILNVNIGARPLYLRQVQLVEWARACAVRKQERVERRSKARGERLPSPRQGDYRLRRHPPSNSTAAIHHRSIFRLVLPLQPINTVKLSALWEKWRKKGTRGEKKGGKASGVVLLLLPWWHRDGRMEGSWQLSRRGGLPRVTAVSQSRRVGGQIGRWSPWIRERGPPPRPGTYLDLIPPCPNGLRMCALDLNTYLLLSLGFVYVAAVSICISVWVWRFVTCSFWLHACVCPDCNMFTRRAGQITFGCSCCSV